MPTEPAPDAGRSDPSSADLAGRRIVDSGFSGDKGEADPALAAALTGYARGTVTDADVLAAVDGTRLLVPMTALPVAVESDAAGLARDKQVDMALPVLIGTDGRRALPAFTSVAALAAWDPAARPVAVQARRAAAGAVQERCAFLVLDPAGPVTWVADRAQVEWLAGVR